MERKDFRKLSEAYENVLKESSEVFVPREFAPPIDFVPISTKQPPEGYVRVFRTIPKKYPYKKIEAGDWVSEDSPSGHDYQYGYNGENWKENNHIPVAFVKKEDLEDQETGWKRGQTLTVSDGADIINI